MSDSLFIYTVYITVNLTNQKFYVGVHKENKTDYIGSGKLLKLAVKKYGRQSFQKYILFKYDNPENAYTKESEIVNALFINRDDTYNIDLGGNTTSFHGHKHTEKTKQLMCANQSGKLNSFYNKTHTEDTKRHFSEIRSGVSKSSEHIRKISSTNSGKPKSKEHIEKLRKASLKCKTSNSNLPKSVVINDVNYNSIGEASRTLNVAKATIRNRIRNPNFNTYQLYS